MPFFVDSILMRKVIFIFSLFLLGQTLLFGQEEVEVSEEEITEDLNYREDQFYVGVTYYLLRRMPTDMSQNGFSSSFQIGFIRDLPLNEARDFSIGIGMGYSANSVNQNLQFDEENGEISYSIVENGSFSKNKFARHLIEIPIEFRWRTSTPEVYKFWRIYPGIKFGYVFASSVKFKGEPKNYKIRGIDDFNKVQYGITLTAGYDKFNAHVYYALNSIFKDGAELNGESLNISVVKIGLMLYIL